MNNIAIFKACLDVINGKIERFQLPYVNILFSKVVYDSLIGFLSPLHPQVKLLSMTVMEKKNQHQTMSLIPSFV